MLTYMNRVTLVAFFASGLSSIANAGVIPCSIIYYLDVPVITFGQIPSDPDTAKFADTGDFVFSAAISGNGNSSSVSSSLKYKKAGEKIEFDGADYYYISGVSDVEFKSQFGLLPNIQCTIP